MKIARVFATLMHVPWQNQLDSRAHPKPILEIVVVRVETDEGLTGSGYTYTDGFGGRSILAMIANDIDELTRGADPNNLESIVADLYWKLRKVGESGVVSLAVAGFDIACWDLLSKAAGKPLVEMLGSYRDRMPVYSSAVGARHLTADDQLRGAREVIEQGFIGVKIQLGRPSEADDIERVRLIREGLGPKPKIVVDANALWDSSQAIRIGRKIEAYDVFYMEEPLPPHDLDGHDRVRRSIGIPLATGEEIFSYRGCVEYLERRLVTYIQPNACRVGGICQWRRVAGVADAFSTKVAPHFLAELHVQLACTVPNAFVIEYFPGLIALLREPPRVADGFIYPRAKPGLGMEFPDEVIEKYRVA